MVMKSGSHVHDSFTYRGPGGPLPNVIKLPVKSAHRMTFALNNVTAAVAVEFCLDLHTLCLHHLFKPKCVIHYCTKVWSW